MERVPRPVHFVWGRNFRHASLFSEAKESKFVHLHSIVQSPKGALHRLSFTWSGSWARQGCQILRDAFYHLPCFLFDRVFLHCASGWLSSRVTPSESPVSSTRTVKRTGRYGPGETGTLLWLAWVLEDRGADFAQGLDKLSPTGQVGYEWFC